MERKFGPRPLALLVSLALIPHASPVLAARVSYTKPPSVLLIPTNPRHGGLAQKLEHSLAHHSKFSLLRSDERMKQLIAYHQGAWKAPTPLVAPLAVPQSAERYLAAAKTHWFDKEYSEALANIDRAIPLLKRNRHQHAELLLDALLTKILIYQDTHELEGARSIFNEALTLDPHLNLKGLPIRGRTRRLFQESKEALLEKGYGHVEIQTKPPVSKVYLNGVAKGITPLKLKGLPEGPYLITLHAEHYRPLHIPISITPQTTQIIDKRLKWTSARRAQNPFQSLSPGNQQALRKMGRSLKVDRIVLLGQSGHDLPYQIDIFDVGLGAKYHTRELPARTNVAQLSRAIEQGLIQSTKGSTLRDPKRHLEVGSLSSSWLRSPRSFWKSKTFYTILGITAGAAIGTTVGILATRGGDSDDNQIPDVGGIDIEFE